MARKEHRANRKLYTRAAHDVKSRNDATIRSKMHENFGVAGRESGDP